MNTFHSYLIWLHIAAGVVAILTFWIPTFARKGGTVHKGVGHWYARAMYVVTVTAFIAALIRTFAPLSLLPPELVGDVAETAKFVRRSYIIGTFLFVLSLLVLANLRHGLLVLRARESRQLLRSRTHLTLLMALGLVGVIGLYIGIRLNFILLQIFSPLAILNSITMLRYSFKRELKRSEWVIEHLSNLLGTGTATHTAVLVLGAARLVNSVVPVSLSILPWIAPGIIGVIATLFWARYYRQRFGHLNKAPVIAKTDAAVNA